MTVALSDDPLHDLTQHNVDELRRAFRLDVVPGGGHRLARALWPFARGLARQALEYDRRFGADGPCAASRWMLGQFTPGHTASGVANLPASGPLLILSNHPGQTDFMTLLAHLPREDLRIIAAKRPLLTLLPNIQRHLISVDEGNNGQHAAVIREATRTLRAGGVVLTYPAGTIEPDPALHADAADSLADWSPSVVAFARMVPGLTVVPTVVRGVLSPRALAHPLARLYRTRKQREWVAATLQVALPGLRDVQPHVTFGPPLTMEGRDYTALHQAVLNSARAMMSEQ